MSKLIEIIRLIPKQNHNRICKWFVETTWTMFTKVHLFLYPTFIFRRPKLIK